MALYVCLMAAGSRFSKEAGIDGREIMTTGSCGWPWRLLLTWTSSSGGLEGETAQSTQAGRGESCRDRGGGRNVEWRCRQVWVYAPHRLSVHCSSRCQVRVCLSSRENPKLAEMSMFSRGVEPELGLHSTFSRCRRQSSFHLCHAFRERKRIWFSSLCRLRRFTPFAWKLGSLDMFLHP